jgi:hypothetical protein
MKHKQTERSLSTQPILFVFFLFNMILEIEDVHFVNGNFFPPHTSNPANVFWSFFLSETNPSFSVTELQNE